MDLFAINPEQFFSFVLTFMRISMVVFLLPIFGATGVPNQVKAAICLVLTLAVWPDVSLSGQSMPAHPLGIVLMLVGEMILGLVLGLVVNFIFLGIQAGGELLGAQMGFTMINIADPVSGNQVGFTAHFLYMVTILVFLTLNGHLYLLRAFMESFVYIPAGSLVLPDVLVRQVLELSRLIFILAIKICAPVMVALFLVELALGIMSRAAPQMHIMEIGFPVKIGVGFYFMILLFDIIALEMQQYIVNLDSMFTNVIRSMGPQ